MGKEDAQDISLRELIRYNINVMEQHKRDSDDFRGKTTKMLSEMNIHGIYSKKKIDEHEKIIEKLNDAHKFQNGALAVISALGLTFLIDFLRRIFT